MKKLLTLLLAAALTISLVACGGGDKPATYDQTPDSTEESTDNVTPIVKTIDHMTIEGICVDDSYRDKDDSPVRLVYLFYTFSATDENLKIDSKYTNLTINDTNTYESDHYSSTASAMEYMPNYYYSSYIEDVYVGSSLKVAATFYIPEGDLAAGRKITISDSQIPGVEDIYFYTDDIEHFENGEEIAKAMDPDGYEEIMLAYEEADEETTQLAKSLMNGYNWWCYVNNVKYTIEFWAPNNFEVRTSLGTNNSGTYSVRNGYIFCTYTSNGTTVKIPYEFEDGDITIDMTEAFDVKG